MDAYTGEIRAVGFNYAPYGWALCQGQTMPINQYTALYSLLGIAYGGDGRTTFALPDLRGRTIVHLGQGNGLSNYTLGQTGGTTTVTLDMDQMPAHTHGLGSGAVATYSGSGGSTTPAGNLLAGSGNVQQYGEESTQGVKMGAGSIGGTIGPVGGGTAHTNMMPSLAVNYIICLNGEFPQRP
ncbi:tail fiber protein [Hymenobacter sp. M29]|uniref:Tail fiber protein n=1 Tax=Hymenobacter mellowenesis TaxID=3063995 RepID=A0ABT9AAE0_9BACT|nr:tail fiber protein [Hymenobacter sp. M29]MDO7846170.1 tail fiber protein [Hymenobacter sp. M29]